MNFKCLQLQRGEITISSLLNLDLGNWWLSHVHQFKYISNSSLQTAAHLAIKPSKKLGLWQIRSWKSNALPGKYQAPFLFSLLCPVLGSQGRKSATYREVHLCSEEFLLVKTILGRETSQKQQFHFQDSLTDEYLGHPGVPYTDSHVPMTFGYSPKQLATLFLAPLKAIFKKCISEIIH